MNLAAIYARLPVWAQHLAVSAEGYRLKRGRYGSVYRTYKEQLSTIYALSYEQVCELQLSRLREFIYFAQKNSPFYSRLYKGLDVNDIQSIVDLRTLPTVDKEMLRRHIDEVYAMPSRKTILARTGGTTGKSLIVRMAKEDMQIRMAELDYWKESHGAYHGMRRVSFSGKIVVPQQSSGPLWRYNRALNQRFYSSFHLTAETAPLYVASMNEFEPEIIDGFANCIADLCRYAKATGNHFTFRPVAVFPTSEPLYPEHRAIIREMLGVEPRDQYASSEGAPFLFECAHGGFHYAMHTGVIEVDENGEALVTSFTTRATPLIRYRIGDRIRFSDRKCTCGWDTPLVDVVEGRSNDYLSSPVRGRVYAANFSNVVKEFPNSVIQTQFVQPSIDEVIVKIVVDHTRFDRSTGERKIINEVRSRLGEQVRVRVEVVEEIPRERSGKIRFIVNELADL